MAGKKLTTLGLARGVYFHSAMLLSTVVGAFFMCFPCFPLYLINYKLYRKAMDNISGFWFTFAASIYEQAFGVKIVCTGDSIVNNERTIMLLNHRTYFDWLFMWSWVLRFGTLQNEKIVLKAALKQFPGAGWAMQHFLFLFLNRRWEADKLHITKLFEAMVELNYPIQLLIFPEGTDMDAKGKARSDKYAKDNGLPAYQYVLHPRVTGFTHTLSILRKKVDAVYDITVGYPEGLPGERSSLLKGDFPGEIHFNCKRYPISEIPESEEEISKWLIKVWDDKEKMLKRFYEQKYFDQPVQITAKNTNPNLPKWVYPLSFVYWHVTPWFCFYLVNQYSPVKWLLASSFLFHIYFTYVHKGFDNIEINMLTSHIKSGRHHSLSHKEKTN